MVKLTLFVCAVIAVAIVPAMLYFPPGLVGLACCIILWALLR